MPGRATLEGVVSGEVFCVDSADRTHVSFVLEDDQRVLSEDGLVVPARIAWCQIICRSEESSGAARTLRPGDTVTVSGALSVVRLTPPDRGLDSVLVSLEAGVVRVLH